MSGKKILAIVLAVVAVAMVGFGIYTMNSGAYIFKKAVSGVFDYVIDSYDEMTDELEEFNEFEKYKISTDNSLIMEDEEFVKLKGDMYFDTKANKSYLDLESYLSGEEFVKFETLLTKDKVYIKFKEALDKFFYTEFEQMEMSFEGLDDEDFELLMNHLEKSILKDVSNKDIEKTSKSIKLDDKNHKTTMVSLGISEKRMATIIENLLKSISEDKKAIQVLQKFDKEITKNNIDDLLKELKGNTANLSTEILFDISFYVEGFGALKRAEISIPTGEMDGVSSNVSLTFDVYKNKHKEKTYLFSIKAMGLDMCTFKVEYTSETKANVDFNAADMIKVTGTLIEEKNNVTLNLELIVEEQKLGTFTYKDIVVKEDKEYKTEIIIEVNGEGLIVSTEEVPSNIKLTSVNTLLVDEKMPNVVISNAVHMDDITDEDAEALDEYFNEIVETLGLNNYDDYEDDYYWDEEDEGYDTFWYDEISAEEVEDLFNSKTPTVLWFGRQTCSYCADFALVLDDSYFDYDYDIYYIDVDTLTSSDRDLLNSLDSRLNVSSTPTTVVLQNGEIKDIHVGYMDETEYYSFLDKNGIE